MTKTTHPGIAYYTPQSPVAPLPMSIDIKVWNPERRKNAHHQQTAAQLRRTLTPHRPDNNSNCNITPHSSHSEDNYYWRPPVRLHKQTPTGVPLVRHSYRNTPHRTTEQLCQASPMYANALTNQCQSKRCLTDWDRGTSTPMLNSKSSSTRT